MSICGLFRFGRVHLRLLLCLAAILWASAVEAQTAEPIACAAEEGQLVCAVDVSAQFDGELRTLLENGFTNDLVYRIYLFEVGQEEPVGLSVVSLAEVFRLYTEVYYISRADAEGYVARNSWEEAVAELSQLGAGFGPVSSLDAGSYFVACILEVNPLSEEQLLEARRWIAHSRGGYRLFGDGEQSFFGTFVSLFVDAQQAGAELRRAIRSEPFEVLP